MSGDGRRIPPPVDQPVLDQIQSQLDLRQPNRDAVETIALRLHDHYAQGSEGFFEGVVDVATGVGKTFVIAGAIDYFAGFGWRNFAVIVPGTTILEKTIAQFTPGHPKSLLGGMSVEPVVVHSGNFRSASVAADLRDENKVKLFVFTVQSLTKPTTKQGRKTHEFSEGLGSAFYAHLDQLDDLIVFADEHHTYHGRSFSKAIRGLTPYAVIGLTATPNRRRLERDGVPIIFRYPLAAAIADRLVKTPVIVGRKDDRTDERTQLVDGAVLLEAKEKALRAHCDRAGIPFVHPVMLVNCADIDHAQEVVAFLRSDRFMDGRYAHDGAVLEIHSKQSEEALSALDRVEEPGSPVRIIVQVGMLKEGWDVKNVYVIVSLRASVSDVLTEQTLGRGLRLPFGAYVDGIPLLNELEIVAHERYEELLAKSKALAETFIDQRTYLAERQTQAGETEIVARQEAVQAPVLKDEAAEPSEVAFGEGSGGVGIAATEERTREAQEEAEQAEHPLEPLRGLGEILVPTVETQTIPSKFKLDLITDLGPFREVGRRLALDPERYFRRTRVGAEIHEDPVGGERIVRTRTEDAKEPLAVAEIEVPADEARAAIVAEVARDRRTGELRRGKVAQVERLLDAVLEGAGEKAPLVLSHYPRRLVREMVHEIASAGRELLRGTQTVERIAEKPLAPRPRFKRTRSSADRHGAFEKGVAYEGWAKSLFAQAWFDSRPERTMANILDASDEIDFWVRLHRNELPILWSAGERTYNPDLLARDIDGDYWLIETKSDKEYESAEVQAKRRAAVAWTNAVNSERDGPRWTYLLVAERHLESARGSWRAIVRATAP